MDSAPGQRSKGLAGLAFVILTVVAMLSSGPPPAIGSGADAVSAFIGAHRSTILLMTWLSLPSVACLMWLSVGLRNVLAKAGDEAAALYAVVLAGFAAILIVLGQGLMGVLAMLPAGDGAFGPFAWATSMYLLNCAILIAAAAFGFVVVHGMRRSGTAPGWLTSLGYLGALLCLAGTFSVFFPAGLMSPTGAFPLIATLVFMLWLACVSILLVLSASKQPAGAGSAA